jgi:hypothetical protein
MKKLILDSTSRSKLGNLNEPLELCDEAGNILGRFTPLSELELFYKSEPQLSEEEFLRIEQEPDISTAELLAQLEKL